MRMPTISRARALLYALVVLIVLGLAGRFILPATGSSDSPPTETLSALPSGSGGADVLGEGDGDGGPGTASSGEGSDPVVVHVAGAVRRPGLYELEPGSRIDDAIREAGGPTRRAELMLVNLAEELVDGQQVVVPTHASGGAPPLTNVTVPPVDPGPVRLNVATFEMLDALPGVGPVTAQKILDYRDEHGPYTSVDELDAIPGIGPARLEQLRELVVP